jgi:putative mRNA 3-end processing factor
MSEEATITQRGAVLLGRTVACDAFDEKRPLRVVTHAHADHMTGLDQSLRKCEKTLMTKATKDFIGALKGPTFLMRGLVETPDYGEPMKYAEEKITLYPADHILGAAQVLVEDKTGLRIGYTGDFRLGETPILNTDILVMEATYGNPTCKRPFEERIREDLVSIVEEGLKQGTVYVFGYHGKLQEIMQILHDAEVDAPFAAPERVFDVSRVCERHGMSFGDLLICEEDETKELLENNSPCVAFYHMGSRGKVSPDSFKVMVSGWQFSSAVRQIDRKEFLIALSDHSDFNGLIEYVRLSKPKLVITDNYRESHAQTLAREIEKRLGVKAVALPK